ncbi:MAG: 50S ribosomal protein L11 methyltransferase [Desulfobacterales bacterium]|jgi:ribosomal protein L11 methyltransferase
MAIRPGARHPIRLSKNMFGQQPVENCVRQDIVAIIATSSAKITPPALRNKISQKYGLTRQQFKSYLRDLIAAGELTYTYQYGCTFLQRSFNRPVRISKYVVIKPPGRQYDADPDEIVIEIHPGASFGTGEHPSTRLAVKGIEYSLKEIGLCTESAQTCCLDVGAGSGILLIAALKFGIQKGIAIDIDPCARAEASENIRRNGFRKEVQISGRPADTINRKISMITANLRYPSLIELCPVFLRLIEPGGLVILSGITFEELAGLIKVYREASFVCVWQKTEKRWAGVVFKDSKK